MGLKIYDFNDIINDIIQNDIIQNNTKNQTFRIIIINLIKYIYLIL